MKAWPIVLLVSVFLVGNLSLPAQEKYLLTECDDKTQSKVTLGDRLKLVVPKGARTNKGRDVDYAEYRVGFPATRGWVWLSGIYGPTATSGQPPRTMTEQTVVSRRAWSFKDVEGIDISGRTATGNYWRYIGMYGEAIKYFDVSREAAEYFNGMLDAVCYNPSGGIGL